MLLCDPVITKRGFNTAEHGSSSSQTPYGSACIYLKVHSSTALHQEYAWTCFFDVQIASHTTQNVQSQHTSIPSTLQQRSGTQFARSFQNIPSHSLTELFSRADSASRVLIPHFIYSSVLYIAVYCTIISHNSLFTPQLSLPKLNVFFHSTLDIQPLTHFHLHILKRTSTLVVTTVLILEQNITFYTLVPFSWDKLKNRLFIYRNTSYLMFNVGNLTIFRPM